MISPGRRGLHPPQERREGSQVYGSGRQSRGYLAKAPLAVQNTCVPQVNRLVYGDVEWRMVRHRFFVAFDGGWLKLNIATLVLILVAAIVFATHARTLLWTPSRIVGASIACTALLFLVVARLQLGGSFSIQAKASTLVTTGLYSRIRNPIYFFGALMVLGIIIFTGQPWFLFFLVVLVPLQVYRARKESQVLEQKFGAEYLNYKRKTWF
jgi:protein-S-isoprenylcysteine O-methyltransferase Ste14